jgi:ELWxxDGT repeat protein
MFHSLRSRVTVALLILAAAAAIPAAAQSPYFVKSTSGYEGWPRDLVAMNGVGYFAATMSTNFSTGQSDEELWRTDGTSAGTYLLKDIRPGAVGSNIQWMTVVGSTLYFTANDGTRGTELWKSDGTAAGTQLAVELNVGSGDGNILSPVVFNGALYFIGTYANGKTYLFKTDGTAAGTQPVSTAVSPSAPTSINSARRLTVWNNRIWFRGNDPVTFAAAASGLYSTDGTAAGTTFLKAIPSMGNDLIAASGQLFFTASDPTYRQEVWRSDGTAAGTFMTKDINPFNAGFNGDSSAWLYQTVGNVALFSANDGGNKRKMWRSDGTAGGTYQLVDVFPGVNEQPNNCTTTGTYAVWEATPGGLAPRQVWATDGSSAGTRLLKSFSGFGQNFLPMDGVIYFRADDGPPAGDELWRTDGTVAGTFLYADIYPGTGGSDPYPIGFAGNRAYLSASGTAATSSYHQLWAFQMCNSSPQPAISMNPGPVCPNGVPASANVTNASSFNSFAWTIVNGAIDSPSSTAPGVSFHATSSSPVLLTVTATAADGCANRTTVTVPITVLPAPVITYVPDTVCPNATIASANVTNYSSPSTFLWTIANGAFDSGATGAAVGFHATGTSPVQLTLQVTDANGCKTTGTASVPIRSIAAPTISLSTPDMCPGSTDTASISGSWASITWTVTNGAIAGPNGGNSAVFTAANSAATVTVTVTDANGCTATNSVQVPIRTIPPPVISLDTPDICPGGSDFASIPGSWSNIQWSVTNGALLGANGGNSAVFTAIGAATVTVTVTDASGCTATNSVQVAVRTIPPPVISLDTPDICPGGSNFATIPGSWSNIQWTVTGGALLGANGGNSAVFTAIGPATVSVTVTDSRGCTATNSVQVAVRTIPPPAISLDTPDICPGGSDFATIPGNWSNIQWTVTHGALLGANGGNSAVFTAIGPATVSVTVTDSRGCTATNSVQVPIRTIPPPVISLDSPEICPGGNDFATIPGSWSNIQWNITGGALLGANGGNSAVFTAVSGTVTVSVTVTNASGCTATATVSVPVRTIPTPVVTASGPTSFCEGGSVTLTAPAGYTYTWSNGATTRSIVVTEAGSYSVTVRDGTGCTAGSATTSTTVNPRPVATIAADGPVSFCAGGNVTLTASAGSSYLWSNGATSQSIVATQSGAYTVSLTNASGCSTTSAATTVTVNALPNATISADGPNSFCTGGSVNLSAPAGAASYLWSTGATTQTIHVAPSSTATYSVTVTDANGCSASASQSVNVYPPPSAAITPSHATTFCDAGNVTLFGSGSGSYLWSTGATTPQITVAASGTYTLTVSNSLCSSTASIDVTVLPAPPKPVITADGPLTFCAGGSVTLTAPDGYTYSWSNPAGATTRSITATTGGNYTVTVISENGCSSTSDAVSVTVVAPPAAPVITATGPTTFCEGGSVTLTAPAAASYLWSNGATTQSIAVATSGTYSVTVANANGCSSAASAPSVVTVNPAQSTPAIAADGPTTFCAGGSVTLTATAGSSYLWSNGATTQSITATTSGSYSVTVTNAGGCSAASAATSVTVNANPAATITASGPTAFCDGGSVTLTATAASSYLWSNGATTQSIAVTASGSYSVTTTNASGCGATSAATSVTVNANPTATITASGPTTFCAGGNVTLTASAASSYLWSNGATTQSIALTASGTYSVTVTNASGCSATSSATSVTVNATPATPVITASGPTAFCGGGSVTLTATASSSYLWSNGATTQSIVVTSSGSYGVTVTNANGCSASSSTTTVTVNSNPSTPVVTAGGPTTFCAGGSVTLTAPASSSYLWSNGATAQSIVVTTSGSYSVTVTNAAGCSASSAATAVTVNANPASTITASGPTTFCAGGSVTLTASAGSSYLWSTGATTQAISATTSGNYTVAITNAAGCTTTSAPKTVTVNPNPVKPVITAGGPTTFCTGGSVTLTAPAGFVSYFWSNGATTQSVTITDSRSVTVTVSNGNCSAVSDPVSVSVWGYPDATITPFGSMPFCPGGGTLTLASPQSDTYTYLWSTGETTANIYVHYAGTYSVTITNQVGCTTTSQPFVVTTYTKPAAVVSGSAAICSGGSATIRADLTGTAPWKVTWSDGLVQTGVTDPVLLRTVSPGSATNYSITQLLDSASNCVGDVTGVAAITFNATPAKPAITAGGPTSFCAGGSVTLTAPASASYLWSNGATTQSIAVTTSGSYTVTVTNASGCSSVPSNPTAVNANVVAATPTVTAGGPTTFCAGGSVTLTASAASSYLWSNGATTQSIAVTASGSYSVTVTNASGCSSAASAPVAVTVNARPSTPVVTAGGPTTFCAGGSVTLTAPASSSYLWSNGATTQSIAVTTSGSYSVTVTNASGCSSAISAVTTVNVNSGPPASISASGVTTFCAGGSVTLTASAGASYLWSTGATTQSIAVTTSGNYSVTVSNASGCSTVSAPTTVTVNSIPAKPVITANGPTTFCAGSVTLTAPAGYASYSWSNGATTQAVTISESRTVTVTVSSGNCSITSDPVTVTVNGYPDVTVFTTGSMPFCPGPAGGSVILSTWVSNGWTHLWSTGETTSNITVHDAGTYTVTITNAAGCSATSQPVVVTTYTKPTAVVSGTGTMCGGSATIRADLTGTAPWSVTWSDGFVQSNVTASPLLRTVSPSSTTTYSILQFTDSASNCVGDATGSATITPGVTPATPTISPSGSINLCTGGSVTLTSSAASGYLWSNGATTQSIVVSTAGNYTVTVSSASGCTATSAAKSVVVNAAPAITSFAPTLQSVVKGHAPQRIQATATGTSLTYQWYSGTSPSTTSPISGATTNSYLPPTTSKGTFKYWMRVTNGSGCVANSATATVTVN